MRIRFWIGGKRIKERTKVEINITNNKKKNMELKRKVQNKGNIKPKELDINWDEYRDFKKAKLAYLKSSILDNLSSFLVRKKVIELNLNDECVVPKNSRKVVYRKVLSMLLGFSTVKATTPLPIPLVEVIGGCFLLLKRKRFC
ncbi:hypothetical protein VNO77_43826 [Canavalia gladiata]|uniref:Uncharacterized protein n=1 Tax=Canavalia gladiata TaxID=3824 RepID=A0AAN9PQD9_CANGL